MNGQRADKTIRATRKGAHSSNRKSLSLPHESAKLCADYLTSLNNCVNSPREEKEKRERFAPQKNTQPYSLQRRISAI